MGGNIKSIVLSESRPLDKDKVNELIHEMFAKSDSIKGRGVFNFLFSDYIYAYEFQKEKNIFQSKIEEIWDSNEERKSVFVLVGENLEDEVKYQRDFRKCIANI